MNRKWEVRVVPVGGSWAVYPAKGPGRIEGWGGLRDQFPKSEKRLKKSLLRCQLWCDRENQREAYSQQVLDKLNIGQES